MNRVKQEIVSSAVDEINVTAPGTVNRRYCFNQDFIGFAGHFPGYPILPAFVQVLTALTLAEEQRGYPLELASVENAKFHIQLRPGQDINVECEEKLVRGKPGCEARLLVAEGLASLFRMSFVAKEDAG
jgi:3-hydroxyacyl-[acyl-carrier-protein] dehydratase